MLSAKLKAILLSIFCTYTLAAQTADENLKDFLTKASEQTKGPACIPMMTDPEGLPMLFSADSLARVNKDTVGIAAINEQLAVFYYKRDADKSIQYSKEAYKFYLIVNNKKRAALCLQNIAFAYQEQKNNIPEAVKYTEQAIQARIELKDTGNLANMYKYMGYLKGKMHQFNEAKKYEGDAITLFKLKKYDRAVAVCYRDLATVFEEEKEPDSCILNIMLAENIWDKYKDTGRLFDANNILLRIYTSENKLQDAETIYHKNESMLNSGDLQNDNRSYIEKLDYYKICQAFFNKKNDHHMAQVYTVKYNAYKDTLKRQGIHVD